MTCRDCFNEEYYESALELMDELIEYYEEKKPLIAVLSLSIERWEEESEKQHSVLIIMAVQTCWDAIRILIRV